MIVNTMILTQAGQTMMLQLQANPSYTITINRVMFSNLYQPVGAITLNSSVLYGKEVEGFILIDYDVFYEDVTPSKLIVTYIDRVVYGEADWMPRSYGFYTTDNTLFCYGNIKPVDTEVQVIQRAGVVFYGMTPEVLARFNIANKLYGFSFNDMVRNMLVGKQTGHTCPIEGNLYSHVTFDSNAKMQSHGIKFRIGSQKYKLVLDETRYMLEGEPV